MEGISQAQVHSGRRVYRGILDNREHMAPGTEFPESTSGSNSIRTYYPRSFRSLVACDEFPELHCQLYPSCRSNAQR